MFDGIVRQYGVGVRDGQGGRQFGPAPRGEAGTGTGTGTGKPCQPLSTGRAHTEKRQTASLQAGKPSCQEDGTLRAPEATVGIKLGDRLTERGVNGIDRQPQH
ncbi:hypothetical protein ACIQ7D_36385 [Streptomyces sp. NPDC096310]|uniref:hypothetical protein n=1 Tax=Streptomyces sp. NPDC096310 TaxID=3366082 RepID=UPI0038234845